MCLTLAINYTCNLMSHALVLSFPLFGYPVYVVGVITLTHPIQKPILLNVDRILDHTYLK